MKTLILTTAHFDEGRRSTTEINHEQAQRATETTAMTKDSYKGTNSYGNSYTTPGGNNSRGGSSYHYSNQNGSYYYSNDNGSKYYDSGKGYSQYTGPSGNVTKSYK